ncbi:MAG: hypothetical protein ACC707_13335, partial [Thiohalomonadales bacterium]
LTSDFDVASSNITLKTSAGFVPEGRLIVNQKRTSVLYSPTKSLPLNSEIIVEFNINSTSSSDRISTTWKIDTKAGDINSSKALAISDPGVRIVNGHSLFNGDKVRYPKTTQYQQIKDSSGNISVFWRQARTGSYSQYGSSIWSNRYSIKTGWTKKQSGELTGKRISPFAAYSTGVIFDIKSVVDETGNITLAWYELDTNLSTIELWATHFDITKGWKTDTEGEPLAVLLGSDIEYGKPIYSIKYPSEKYTEFGISVDLLGNVTLIFMRGTEVLSQRWDALTKKWNNQTTAIKATPKIIYNNNSGLGVIEKVLTGDNGEIALFWYNNWNIYVSQYKKKNGRWINRQLSKLSKPTTAKNIRISNPKYVMDHLGNITVAWIEVDSSAIPLQYKIQTVQYSIIGGGWRLTLKYTLFISPLLKNSQDRIFDLGLESTNNGKTIAVWRQANQIMAAESDVTTGWSFNASGQILTHSIDTSEFVPAGIRLLKSDGFGTVTVVWSAGSPKFSQPIFRATRYNKSTGWQKNAAGSLEGTTITNDISENNINTLRSEIDTLGNIHLLWTAKSPARNINLHYTKYDRVTDSWEFDTPGVPSNILLENNNEGDVGDHNFAVDGMGNILVTWIQHDGSLLNLYANRYNAVRSSWWTNETGIIAGKIIESDKINDILSSTLRLPKYDQPSYYKPSPFPVTDGVDKFTVIWRQYGESNTPVLWVNRYD